VVLPTTCLMSPSSDLLGSLLQGFSDAMSPLSMAISSANSMAAFLADLGWYLDPNADLNIITTVFQNTDQAIQSLLQAAQAIDNVANDDEPALLTAIEATVNAIKTTINAISTLEDTKNNIQSSWLAPFNKTGFWSTFPHEVLDYLICTYIRKSLPKTYGIFRFLGIVSSDWTDTQQDGREPFHKLTVHWDLIPKFITGPQSLFSIVYGWGSTFDHHKFSNNIEQLLTVFNLQGTVVDPTDPVILAPYYDPASIVLKDIIQLNGSIVSVIGCTAGQMTAESVILVLLPIPPADDKKGQPVGFAIFPVVNISGTVELHVSDDAILTLSGGFESAPIRAEFRPSGVTISPDSKATEFSAKAKIDIAPQNPLILLGGSTGTRLEVGQAHASLGADFSDTKKEYTIELGFDSADLVIDLSKSDGFLQKVLGSQPQKLSLSSAITYSNLKGFGFRGQAQLEANIAVHLSIGDAITINTIYISLRAGNDEQTGNEHAELIVAASVDLSIGPVSATVDQIGLKLNLLPVPKGQPPGNLGSLQLGFGFKPPKGLGISIDDAGVVGGGYLSFDADKGVYAGALELSIEDIQIKAIGILTTKMPDGSKGFSFVIIISTEFTPIQLGLGFTLNGVGGLLGINRTMNLDALRAGLKNHTLNSILFPTDPVKNAQQIVSDLSTVFPPSDGRYTFGPMIKIGWGTPTLMVGELGIVFELPSPVRVSILGQIRAAIPTEAAALILINIDILGTIDFGLKKLAIDASLYDSRVTSFALMGESALRLNWGDDPLFIFSLGGLHPHFQPPPEFPHLARLTVSLGSGDNPRFSLEAYMAVTSNTFQFGAHFELFAEAGGFQVHGYLGFDALFIFSPFHFEVEMCAGVDVSYDGYNLLGISLDLQFAGPSPWSYDGLATLHILFFSITKHVSGSFGDGGAPSLPPASVMAPLLTALQNKQSWSATLPADAERAVTLSAPKPDGAAIYVHPMGSLQVTQSVVPLDTVISKFGNTVPSDGDKFTISSSGTTLNQVSESITFFNGRFAPSQYRNMSDADKLAAKSFEPFPAGIIIGSTEIRSGAKTELDLEYDTRIIDNHIKAARPGIPYRPTMIQLLALSEQGAGALSKVWSTGNAKFKTPGMVSAITNLDSSYVIVDVDNLQVNTDLSPESGSNQYQARSALEAHLQAHPEDEGKYQVMIAHEVKS
jgi:hypothetical protein